MRAKLWIVASMLVAGSTAFAETAKERADRAYEGFPNIVRDLQYKTVERFEDVEQLSMDLILPEKTKYESGAPVVLFIHGGGWSGGERYVLGRGTFEQYTDAGIAVACISYRLAKDGNSALECLIDCKDAARFLVKNSAKFRLDPTRFATRGHSAGGHLALCVALVPDEEPILKGDASLAGFTPIFVCAVAEAPLTTLFHPEQSDSANTITMNLRELQKILGGKSAEQPSQDALIKNRAREEFILSIRSKSPIRQVAKILSPEFWLDTTSPPILLVHGTADPLISVRGARHFKKLADKRGTEIVYIEVENGGHDFRSTDSKRVPSHSLEELGRRSGRFTKENLLKGIRSDD